MPPHRQLQDPVQFVQADIAWNLQLPPNSWLDACECHLDLIDGSPPSGLDLLIVLPAQSDLPSGERLPERLESLTAKIIKGLGHKTHECGETAMCGCRRAFALCVDTGCRAAFLADDHAGPLTQP